MNRLLLAGRLALLQPQIIARPFQEWPCGIVGESTVRRASMNKIYPVLDIKGQTVLITGTQIPNCVHDHAMLVCTRSEYTLAYACTPQMACRPAQCK